MSTLVVYADTSDGRLWFAPAEEATNSDDAPALWAYRMGQNPPNADTTSSYLYVHDILVTGIEWDEDYYEWVQRTPSVQGHECFVSFDTHDVGTGTVSSAVLSITSGGPYSNTTFQARLHDWGATLTTADWVSAPSAKTLIAHYDMSGGWVVDTAYNFVDDAFAANVNKTGSTRLLLCTLGQATGEPPLGTYGGAMHSADYTGTTRDPKLTVTYAAGSTEVYDGPGPTLDAWIIATRTGSFTAAAILKRTQVGSFTADAAIKSTVAGSFTTNAVLLRGQTGSFAANAITLKAASSSFTAAATIKATVADSTKADAIRLRTFWFGRVEDGF